MQFKGKHPKIHTETISTKMIKTDFGFQYSRAIPNRQEINFQARLQHCDKPHPTAMFTLRWRCQTNVRRVCAVVLPSWYFALTITLVLFNSVRWTWQTSSPSLPREYPSYKATLTASEKPLRPPEASSLLFVLIRAWLDCLKGRQSRQVQQPGRLLVWRVQIAPNSIHVEPTCELSRQYIQGGELRIWGPGTKPSVMMRTS